MKLNIIGNGFDMYHGLPCSYYYFGCYLLQYHPEFYEKLARMYGFGYMISAGYEDYEYGVQDIFWRYFEERLGEIDPIWVEGTLQDELGLECPDPVDLELPEIDNSTELKEYFQEWVSTTVDTEENYKIIKKYLGKNKLDCKKQDYYINYNYTHTLEKIYDIPEYNVFHIHGECDGFSDLIIGHGNNDEIIRLMENIEDLEDSPEYYGYQSTRNRYIEYSCELSNLEDLKKDTDSLISEMEMKLNQLGEDILEICVWGFSCGTVDMPYIIKLNELYPDVRWTFSYYDESEKKEREKLANQLGLTNVGLFELNNSKSNSIKKKLVIENNIQEYKVI